jgi:sugar transferase (PEP-CTERM/EpsH1 system associated)
MLDSIFPAPTSRMNTTLARPSEDFDRVQPNTTEWRRQGSSNSPCAGPGHLRILHVFSYLGLGGTELTALRVIAGLERDLFENRLCGVRGFNPQLLWSRHPDAVVAVPAVGKKSRIQILPLIRLIKSYRPHIIHSRNWGAIEAVAAARWSGVPIVIHSEHGYEMDSLAGLPLRRRIFRRAAYAMADRVFTVTNELRDYHARQAWYPSSKILMIPNGVDTHVYASSIEARNRVRERVGMGADRFVIGSVGRMVPIKDYGTLLDAAALLVQRGLDVYVLLVGSGPELIRHQEYVRASAVLAGRVCFLGETEKVAEVLNALDVFVLPSFSEGMSNTLLEAMACGLPVVATEAGGNSEVIGPNQSCGRMFAPGDAKNLAKILETLATSGDLRRRLGEGARACVVSNYSLERMIANYRRLYAELAVQRGILTRSSI